MTASARARSMLIDVCGPRSWADTREAWLARGARKCRTTFRRAKKLFYKEPLRLGADEYDSIQQAWAAATQAVEASDDLARNAAALADSAAQRSEQQRLRDRAKALTRELEATNAALRSMRSDD